MEKNLHFIYIFFCKFNLAKVIRDALLKQPHELITSFISFGNTFQNLIKRPVLNKYQLNLSFK